MARSYTLFAVGAFTLSSLTLAPGCSRNRDVLDDGNLTAGPGGTGADSSETGESEGEGESDESDEGDEGGGLRLDVGDGRESDGGGDGGNEGDPCDPELDENCECETPEHVACDDGTDDPFNAMGLNCPGEPQVAGATSVNTTGIGIRSSFGPTDIWNSREGSVYAVIGSGPVNELDSPRSNTDLFGPCSTDLDPPGSGGSNNTDLGPSDPGNTLPDPINPNAVDQSAATDCGANPALIGTGDCSNTLQEQWDMGALAFDYTEIRFTIKVPDDVVSFSYDFAFFTTEWPKYFGFQYNDLYVGWLESEQWTGNISFDNMGNPITLNAVFFEYFNQGGALAPELADTCMNHHGGTNWLTSTAPVQPGEEITVVFAIFDLSDNLLDSYVFLDNFQWGCVPTTRPETVPPVG